MKDWRKELDNESKWITDEYERCYGVKIPIRMGSSMEQVHSMQSAIIRYWVEELKKKVEK